MLESSGTLIIRLRDLLMLRSLLRSLIRVKKTNSGKLMKPLKSTQMILLQKKSREEKTISSRNLKKR